MNESRSWTDQMKWHKECGRWQKHNTGFIIIAIEGCAWSVLLQRSRGSWEWELSTSRWWRLELTLLLHSRRKSGGRQEQCGGLVLSPRVCTFAFFWLTAHLLLCHHCHYCCFQQHNHDYYHHHHQQYHTHPHPDTDLSLGVRSAALTLDLGEPDGGSDPFIVK